MAILTATYEYNVDDFRLKYYVNQWQSHFLEQDVNNPQADNYSIFTARKAFELLGDGFGYNGNHEMVKGEVEGLAEWFWDTGELAWTKIYDIVNARKVDSSDFWDALQSGTLNDDIAVLGDMLAGNDTFRLSSGHDKAKGFGGSDKMHGYGGKDVLIGMDGNDKLYGGNNKDYLHGGNGNDILRGGNGTDKSVGGAGSDTFRFLTGDDKEVIMDFQVGVDVVDLAGLNSVRHMRDLRTNHWEQVGDDVHIDGGNGDLIIMKNVDLDDLSYRDFVF